MGREIMDMPAPAADHRIAYGEDEQHFGELRLPMGDGPHPLVISIHGGFWRAARTLAYMGHVCEALRAAGIATWNIEYRRVGQKGGGYPGTLDDAAAASAHLIDIARSFPIDLARVAAVGHSAGGYLALWLAGSGRGTPLRAAISLGGVADLDRAAQLNVGDGASSDFMGGKTPPHLIPRGIPQVLIHGEADTIVPIEVAESYCARAAEAGQPCRLVRLPSAGHFEVIDPRAAEWSVVRDAIINRLQH